MTHFLVAKLYIYFTVYFYRIIIKKESDITVQYLIQAGLLCYGVLHPVLIRSDDGFFFYFSASLILKAGNHLNFNKTLTLSTFPH